MPPTLRGIYHNLKESKYTVSNGETVFFFSSRLYMMKFLEGYEHNRLKISNRIENAIACDVLNFEFLVDINFYKKIEKRGFYVWIKGIEFTWHELNLYALRQMTLKNSNVWHEIQRPKLKERLKIME